MLCYSRQIITLPVTTVNTCLKGFDFMIKPILFYRSGQMNQFKLIINSDVMSLNKKLTLKVVSLKITN